MTNYLNSVDVVGHGKYLYRVRINQFAQATNDIL